jgi:hypothetical protein
MQLYYARTNGPIEMVSLHFWVGVNLRVRPAVGAEMERRGGGPTWRRKRRADNTGVAPFVTE